MLVLSRGNNDKIVFPTLGISVEILRIAGKKVRLGIAAPKEIPVHRHEIAKKTQEAPCHDAPAREQPRLSHSVRNRLHTASLALHVLGRKLELEETTDAEAVIFRILNELKAIEGELEGDVTDFRPSRPTSRYRALIVEDDDNERELLTGFLEMSGFEVDTAIDGMQAMVQLTKRERPDVVLLDMKMPRLDGSKTISAIRCNPAYRGLRVFAVSGSDRDEMNVALGDKGVNRWFAKPLDPRMLVEAIREELSRERAAATA
jgi:carbon storage regulator CsrA